MTRTWLRPLVCSLLLGLQASFLSAQSLTTGDVTVKVTQDVDSAIVRPGQAFAGYVLKSSNAAIPRMSPVTMQITGDAGQALSIHLAAIQVSGQMVRVGSTAGSPSGFSKIIGMSRTGAPPVSGSGTRVYLPQGTDLKFTLSDPPAAPAQPLTAARPLTTPTSSPPPHVPAPRLSPTTWTPYPDQGGVVPDAAMLGQVAVPNTDNIVGQAALLLGCEARGSSKQPVFRLVLPRSMKFDLSTLGTTPTTTRAKDKTVMQFDVNSNDGKYMFLGNRMMYIAKSTPSYTLVQYDADPREMGSFIAATNAGKIAAFRIGDLDMRELRFKVPPATDTLTAVTKACDVAEYPGSYQLAPGYIEKLIAAAEMIEGLKVTQEPQPAELKVFESIVITKPEWDAFQDQERFFEVSLAENEKSKGRVIPPRRKRCGDAFIAQFKTGSYKLPAACAYVGKEAPE